MPPGDLEQGKVDDLVNGSDDWTARTICRLCFRKMVRKHDGRVPDWPSS